VVRTAIRALATSTASAAANMDSVETRQHTAVQGVTPYSVTAPRRLPTQHLRRLYSFLLMGLVVVRVAIRVLDMWTVSAAANTVFVGTLPPTVVQGAINCLETAKIRHCLLQFPTAQHWQLARHQFYFRQVHRLWNRARRLLVLILLLWT
jgi:hypothetical protein